jgi:hypothetical protein
VMTRRIATKTASTGAATSAHGISKYGIMGADLARPATPSPIR